MTKKTDIAKMSESTHSTSGRNRVSLAIFILVFLLCLAIGVAGYFYYQYRHVILPENDTVEEVTLLIQEIGAMMELPGDETPTLATVTDREKLADQPFFQKAQNGDKVLIYTSSGRAILYRPSIRKIVDVTLVNVANNQPAEAPKEAVNPPEAAEKAVSEDDDALLAVGEIPSIALYNGTTKLGLTQRQEATILRGFGEMTILEKESAKNTAYKKTIVVDVSGKYTDLALRLAMKYKAEIGNLPVGERETTADILIIFGEDQL